MAKVCKGWYLTRNNPRELLLTIKKLQDKIEKINKKIEDYSCIYNKGFPYDLLLAVRGKYPSENQYLELDKVLKDFKKIIGGE